MVFKLEEKEETTIYNVLNLTPLVLLKFSLHTDKFFHRLTYYQALKIGRAGVVAPLVASGAVVPIIVSIARGTMPSLLSLTGLFLVLIGVAISTLASGTRGEEPECPSPPCRGAIASRRQPRRLKWQPERCIVLAIAAALAFGTFFILFNQGSAVAGAGLLWVIFGVQVGCDSLVAESRHPVRSISYPT